VNIAYSDSGINTLVREQLIDLDKNLGNGEAMGDALLLVYNNPDFRFASLDSIGHLHGALYRGNDVSDIPCCLFQGFKISAGDSNGDTLTAEHGTHICSRIADG